MAIDLPLLDLLVGSAVGAKVSCVAIPVIYRAVRDLRDRALTEEDLVKRRALLEASRHPESRRDELATRVVRPSTTTCLCKAACW
jgi:divalent metal cation (Fe/Co/Zn/Cd) transporter